MTMPSHALLMASVDALQLIEVRDGYRVAKQASDLLDQLLTKEHDQLEAMAARRTRNEAKHCLWMLLRRDARAAGIVIPCLAA